jgi:hypothetical protein
MDSTTLYKKIASFLRSKRPESYCDSCISGEVSELVDDVRRETKDMKGQAGFLPLDNTICTRCGEVKDTIRAS